MYIPSKVKASVRAVALAFALGTTSFSANAVLERVGPTNLAPSVGGFPSWYQDTSGLTLEFCNPKNQAEVDGGWCLLLPGDVNVPEVFPTNFFDEHFYYAADAVASTANGAKALLVMAVESAFAVGPAIAGDQITFSRIRVVLNPVPATGTYRIIHPYGEETIDAVAGDRIFFTEDIGIGAPGDFSGALNSRLGPFLLPANTPGGAELPATAGPSGLYIADPGRSGPVTGSSLPNFIDSTGASRNHNIFRIEGPAGSGLGVDPTTGASVDFVETTNFSLMGRIMTSALPGRVGVDRASYTRDATGQKVDVFATAFPTTQGRLPTQLKPAPIAPQLTFFNAPCAGTSDPITGEILPPFSAPAGVAETQMFATGGIHWGQIQPAAIPSAVCVKDGTVRDATGAIIPSYVPKLVTDEVQITQALYDPSTGTLTVAATSSDTVAPPVLTLAHGTFLGDLVNGQISVPGIIAPAERIHVLSSYLGDTEHKVSTGFAAAGAPTPAGIPVAANDAYTFVEDTGAQSLAVLANDNNAVGGTVTLTSAPRLGTATVGAGGVVTYTPNLNASGSDAFTYTVTAVGKVSNTATVTLNITPVNDAPVAVNDSASAIANIPVQINVLTNDTDPDGAADLAAAVIVTPPAGAAISVAGGVVTFNAAAGGSYSFTYQARDAAGVLSANTATVTVQVAAAETLSITRAEYVLSKGRIKVQGTITPVANQKITLEFVDSAGVVLGLAGTAIEDVSGNWAIDTAIARPAGATAVKATSSNGSVRSVALIAK